MARHLPVLLLLTFKEGPATCLAHASRKRAHRTERALSSLGSMLTLQGVPLGAANMATSQMAQFHHAAPVDYGLMDE